MVFTERKHRTLAFGRSTLSVIFFTVELLYTVKKQFYVFMHLCCELANVAKCAFFCNFLPQKLRSRNFLLTNIKSGDICKIDAIDVVGGWWCSAWKADRRYN